MTLDEVRAVVARVKLGGPFEGKWFHVGDMVELQDDWHRNPNALPTGIVYVQVRYFEPDIYTGEQAEQRARVWLVAPNATESQVVQICFGAALASAEHQCREFFTYDIPCIDCEDEEIKGCASCDGKGGFPKRVFGPHMDIADLAGVAR